MTHLLLVLIYLAFISLGLPDGALGAGWPSMYSDLAVPVGYAGLISMVIAGGTIVSSLNSDRLTRRLGTGVVTVGSVAMTAVALGGFSISHTFGALLLWAIPYGLGAGSVDAALNNYVALHYKSAHMSWLHCMWGVGTMSGPYIMGFVLAKGLTWNTGYLAIALIQVVLTAILLTSLPLWRQRTQEQGADADAGPLTLRQVMAIPGARAVMVCFLCYCGIESTTGLWASTFLKLARGVTPETAATFGALFYIGITLGRAACGFLTYLVSDETLIRGGTIIIAAGSLLVVIPDFTAAAIAGFVLVGIGCAPVYPCIIHPTPARFGVHRSQAIIGVEMAAAYVGTLALPPLFGLIAEHASTAVLPAYLFALAVVMGLMHERLIRATRARSTRARVAGE